jgi:hypothetical protein
LLGVRLGFSEPYIAARKSIERSKGKIANQYSTISSGLPIEKITHLPEKASEKRDVAVKVFHLY